MKTVTYAFLCLFLVCSCKTSESNSKSSAIAVDKIAKENLGDSFERTDKGKFALCVTPSDNQRNWRTVVVINTETGELTYGPERMNADVSWHSETQLRIREYPERIEDVSSSDTFMYIYDLIEKRKITTAQ